MELLHDSRLVVLFLVAATGVGTRSGIFAAAAIVSCTVAKTLLVVGRKVLRIAMPMLTGIVAGVHTQPAVLAFAMQRAKSDQPNVGHASVYPFATIAKIVFAQVLLAVPR